MIKLLNGEEWSREELLVRMLQDDFYYGYLGQNALSSSSAKELLKGAKAYHNSLSIQASGQALRDGRLIHLNLLEPEKVENLHIVNGTKATKAFKEAVKLHGIDNVYTNSEQANAHFITKELNNCKPVRDLLDGAAFEVPEIGCVDGLPFRAKADILRPNCVIDLKTTSDIGSFKYTAKKYGYDLQAALYMELFGVDEFQFIVIDKNTKQIGVYDVSGSFIDSGWEKLERAIKEYRIYTSNSFNLSDYVEYGTL